MRLRSRFSRPPSPLEEAHLRAERLSLLLQERQETVIRFREELRILDAERGLFEEALDRLRPGLEEARLAEELRDLVFEPFRLSSFFVARVDWGEGRLRFPLFHEGGRPRRLPPVPLGGLTARALAEGRPLYVPSAAAGSVMGAVLSRAELSTGLVPETWFGVPLGLDFRPRPFGLVSYQAEARDAFSPLQREGLVSLARILARAMDRGPEPAYRGPCPPASSKE